MISTNIFIPGLRTDSGTRGGACLRTVWIMHSFQEGAGPSNLLVFFMTILQILIQRNSSKKYHKCGVPLLIIDCPACHQLQFFLEVFLDFGIFDLSKTRGWFAYRINRFRRRSMWFGSAPISPLFSSQTCAVEGFSFGTLRGARLFASYLSWLLCTFSQACALFRGAWRFFEPVRSLDPARLWGAGGLPFYHRTSYMWSIWNQKSICLYLIPHWLSDETFFLGSVRFWVMWHFAKWSCEEVSSGIWSADKLGHQQRKNPHSFQFVMTPPMRFLKMLDVAEIHRELLLGGFLLQRFICRPRLFPPFRHKTTNGFGPPNGFVLIMKIPHPCILSRRPKDLESELSDFTSPWLRFYTGPQTIPPIF